MEIEIFTLCDFAQDNHSKLTVVGTFDSIHSKQFPFVQANFSVACRLRFSEKETGQHTMRLRFINGSGEELMKPIEGQMNILKPQNGQYSAANLVFNFNQVKFDKTGRYSFELYIDDEWKSGLPLFINQIA
ncbi:MAG TPA: hypothetical protein VJ765_04575 [Chitinophagaceae bacterium]|nr:hypothetical protein [Chitinophagaceae bacterium]